MININNIDPNKFKIDLRSYKNILSYYIRYSNVSLKCLRYVKINSIITLYLIMNKINGYFEKSNGNKYLTVAPTNENKETIRKNEAKSEILSN